MSNGTTAVPVSPVVNDLIATINAGQAAIARLPELEATIRDLTAKLDASQAHAQELELKGRDYRDQIDHLHGQVRSLREERDDASFRELETQDKLDKLVAALHSYMDGLGSALSRAVPPKAPEPAPQPVSVPVPEPVKVPITESGQSATSPSSAPSTNVSPPNAGETGAGSTDASGNAGMGQSDPRPTASEGSANPSENVAGHGAENTNPASSEPTTAATPDVPWWELPEYAAKPGH